MEMKIIVKESSMIRPAAHTSSQHLWCSPLDLDKAKWKHTGLLFYYKPDGSSDFFDLQLLKQALSNVLVPFYPAAGRLGRDENGRIQINCNAQGVLFVEAEATTNLDYVNHIASTPKLFPPVDYSGHLSSYPLILIQVTRFKCGGVCVGVKSHHVLTDGSSLFHFVTSWSDMARGEQINVSPFFDRATIIQSSLKPPAPAFHHIEFDPPPSMSIMPTLPTTTISFFKISGDQLNKLRARSIKIDNQSRKYSTYCILAAQLWRCVSEARGLPRDQATKLRIPVDGRFRLKHPPLPSGFFGNAVLDASTIALAGDLLSEPFANTVERIHKATNQHNDDAYLQSAYACLENLLAGPSMHEEEPHKCPNLCISDLSRIPVHKANFGWDAPNFMGLPPPGIGAIYIVPPSSTDDNDPGITLIADLETSCIKLFQELIGLKPVSKL